MKRNVPLVIVELNGTHSLRDFIKYALLADQRFNSNFEQLRRAGRIADACSESLCLLDEGDWEQLRDAVQNPMPMPGRPPYLINPGHANLPFIEAIVTAPKAEE